MVNIYFPSSGLQSQTQTPVVNRSADTASPNGQRQAIDTLLGKLAENIPEMGSDELKALNGADFTPEKVATRISDFVAAGLASAAQRGASDEQLKKLYQSALEGAEAGFAEAREVLDQLGVLQGAIAAQVDETETATRDALAAIAPGGNAPVFSSDSIRLGIVERFSNAEDMELTIRTQDGDAVTVRFSRNLQQESSLALQSDESGLAASFSLSRSERSEYRFSIEGDLDEGEIDALNNLIKDVSNLADEFFDGDVQKAFEQSAGLNFDSSELASMSLTMSYSRQYASASSYEQMQQLDQPQDRPGLRLGHLMKALAESVGAPSLGFLSAPGQFGRELLSGLIQQDSRYLGAPDEQQQEYDDNLSRLIDAVLPVAENEPAALLDRENAEL
ncbi:DUF5610 domain-containing protein [Marinobacterium zhoushanense]|uniref:DUF5610 domain-containing protein n=1 Tax=Marinobacterium zhoushanense TaxID=1679163 RepID=UPI00166CA6E4|nr:DUF5610 domain-containing protein [Marinobacterium zhoushanense]